MRGLIRVKSPIVSFDSAVGKGTAGTTIQETLAETKLRHCTFPP